MRLANRVRAQRARLKADLKAGRVPLVPLLTDPPDWLEKMKVIDLLLATPKPGQTKVAVLLRRTAVSPSRTVGGLSDRQRQALVDALKDR